MNPTILIELNYFTKQHAELDEENFMENALFSSDSGARSMTLLAAVVLVDRRPSTASSAASNGAGAGANGYFYGAP